MEIENGFHTYYLIPRPDLDLFPGCVTTVKIRYLADNAKELEIEDEASKPGITGASRFKDHGMMALLEGWEERQKRLEEAAMKHLYGPDYKKSPEAEKTEEEKN